MTAQILIVDDYVDTLSIYQELFEMQGYCVSTASSEEAAMASLQAHWPILVIVDDDHGETSGVSLIARLKRFAMANNQGRLLAIAIRGDFLAGEEPLLPGFDYVVSKPLDFDFLDSLVKRCVALQA